MRSLFVPEEAVSIAIDDGVGWGGARGDPISK